MRSLAALAAVCLVASTAAAQPGMVDPRALQAAPPPYLDEEPASYSGQILVADALSLGMLVLGAQLEGPDGRDSDASGALYLGGALGAWGASPIIHAAHGHGLRAAASTAMRQAFSVGALLVSIETNAGCDGLFCELEDAGAYFFGGLVIASLLDVALLSHGTALTRKKLRPAWQPTLAPTDGGAQAGLAGTW